jgi:hypothetical protein
MLQFLVTANVPSLPILFTLMMDAIRSSETSVLKKPRGVTSQNAILHRLKVFENVAGENIWTEEG